MFDTPKFFAADEEELEDFHDYDDEEHTGQESKLDEYEDSEDDDDEDEDEATVVVIVEAPAAEPAPAVAHHAPAAKNRKRLPRNR